MDENKNCFHLGHLILDCFRNRPKEICHIDASTGQSETNASVLSRSTQLACSLRAFGVAPGDVVALSGRNHLDLHVPYYAALFNGLPLVGVDPLYKLGEITHLLKLTSPKITFCEPEDYELYVQAAKDLGLAMKIVTFGEGEHSMASFKQKYWFKEIEDNFNPAVIDTSKAYVWLISTSGTSGAPKLAAITHDAFLEKTRAFMKLVSSGTLPKENKPALSLSPVQWVSGLFNHVCMPLMHQTVVQTSAPVAMDHVVDLINTYKPVHALLGPAIIWRILRHDKKCDLTCFDSIILTGAKISEELLNELRSRIRPEASALEFYGQTETLGPVLAPRATPGSCGSPMPYYQIKLVDSDTGVEITESNVTGEMLVKGNIMFTEYYGSPEDTKAAFTEDGWYRTGDMFYKDENNNYFYVERVKTLIKYQNYHVFPIELEQVILTHPAVYEVVVTGVPHSVDGERPVACVVLREVATVTADEIKELVANNLSEKKQLRGGVLFLKEMPLTSTGKVCLSKVKEMAIHLLE